MIIALFLVAIMVVIIMLVTPNNSACTGNCRQGRDCNCTGKSQ